MADAEHEAESRTRWNGEEQRQERLLGGLHITHHVRYDTHEYQSKSELHIQSSKRVRSPRQITSSTLTDPLT